MSDLVRVFVVVTDGHRHPNGLALTIMAIAMWAQLSQTGMADGRLATPDT